MSDILIKNMKMPDKATTIVIFSEGKARVFRQDIDHDEWLTAIEVPSPHGRLIDADALAINLLMEQHMPFNAFQLIMDAPTIIEATVLSYSEVITVEDP